MKKNESYLSSHDLDLLIKQAFLEVDFTQPQNQQMLEAVNRTVFSKPGFFSALVRKTVIHKLFFIISFILLTGGFLIYLGQLQTAPAVQRPMHSAKAAKQHTSAGYKKEEPVSVAVHPENKASSKNISSKAALPVAETNATISGYIRNARNGVHLAGAAVYEPSSKKGISATEQGYYSLALPKGEHQIQVLLQGYQTYTFSVYLEDNVSKNIELQETSELLDEVTVRPAEYMFPNLTEKEKKANEKEKQKMARTASRLRPGKDLKYSLVPAPADKAFPAFYMQSNEVSNLEYRTFLFDL